MQLYINQNIKNMKIYNFCCQKFWSQLTANDKARPFAYILVNKNKYTHEYDK